MSHVNKVVIGAHSGLSQLVISISHRLSLSVMANGGLVAHAGCLNISAAAKHYSVPVIVVTGLHKLCPFHAFDQCTVVVVALFHI